VRAAHAAQEIELIEVFVDTPVGECRRRDPRGLYARADRAEITHMTGVDDPYEPPEHPEVRVHPGPETVEQCTEAVLRAVRARLRT
jgi:adenylylsulfate kinase-like enzyme